MTSTEDSLTPALRWFIAQSAVYGFLAAYPTRSVFALVLAVAVSIITLVVAAALADPELRWLWQPPLSMLAGSTGGFLLACWLDSLAVLVAAQPQVWPQAAYVVYITLAVPIALHGAIGTFGVPSGAVMALAIAGFVLGTVVFFTLLFYTRGDESAKLTARLATPLVGIALSSSLLYGIIGVRLLTHLIFIASALAWSALGFALHVVYFTTASHTELVSLRSADPRAKAPQIRPTALASRWFLVWLNVTGIVVIAIAAQRSILLLVLFILLAVLFNFVAVFAMHRGGGSASLPHQPDERSKDVEAASTVPTGAMAAAPRPSGYNHGAATRAGQPRAAAAAAAPRTHMSMLSAH